MFYVYLFTLGPTLLFAALAFPRWRRWKRDGEKRDYGTPVVGFLTWLLTAIATVCLVGSLIVIPLTIGDRIGCRNRGVNLGLPTRWSVSAGCYYQLPDGSWWPSDKVRNVDGQLRVAKDVRP